MAHERRENCVFTGLTVVSFLLVTALAEALRARSDDSVADAPPLQVPPLRLVLCLNATGGPDLCRPTSFRARCIHCMFYVRPHRPLPIEDLPTIFESTRPPANATSDIKFCREQVGFEAEKDVQSWPLKLFITGEHLHAVPCLPFLEFRPVPCPNVTCHTLPCTVLLQQLDLQGCSVNTWGCEALAASVLDIHDGVGCGDTDPPLLVRGWGYSLSYVTFVLRES